MKTKKIVLLPFSILFLIGSVIFTACYKEIDVIDPLVKYDPQEEMPGGEGSSESVSTNAFGLPVTILSGRDKQIFGVGNAFFKQNWVTAVASTTSIDGLGPLFNASSCGGCHIKDGRAAPPKDNKGPAVGLLFRLSISGQGTHGEPIPHPSYGGQFADNALQFLGSSLPKVIKEGTVHITYKEVQGQYPDGTKFSLRHPTYTFQNLGYGSISDAMVSPRIAPQIIGMGLLEAIDEADILSYADPNDKDGDGISGRPNYVYDRSSKTTMLGRFGWKSNEPTVRQQTAGAFLGDIGITSSLFLDGNLTPDQATTYAPIPNGGIPEIPNSTLDKVVLYTSNLAVPARRKAKDEQILKGKRLFFEANCNACHVSKYQTGNGGEFAVNRGQTIFPYTDLLLHDMGDQLADNRPDFLATGKEWRTPPLWGIGLIKTVNRHTTLMHDGRARNVEEAILWHGGEAEASKNTFMKMVKSDRQALIDFVNDL